MVSMRELSEKILGQTILNKETKDYMMTPRGPVRRPEEAVQVEESIFTKPLDMEGRFSILPLRDMPDGTREYALPLPMAEMMNAFTAPGRSFMQPDFDAEKEALDTALAFTGGSSVGTAPVGSLAMGAPRRPKGIQATAKMPKMSKDQLIQAGYYHPIGENKLRTLVGDVDFETTPSGILVPKRTLKPEDLEGGRIVFDAGDRAVAGQKLVRVNGIELDDPIDLRGGPDFMRYGEGSVWASDGSAVTAINKQARGSEGDAYFLPTLMSPISVNFQHHDG
jgi:hypothetical protein